MKQQVFIFIVFSLFFFSCKPKVSEPIEIDLADGRGKITVLGRQENWAEPWEVFITMEYNGVKIDRKYGIIYVWDLEREDINLLWVKPNQCKLIFNERDGNKSEVLLKPIPFE